MDLSRRSAKKPIRVEIIGQAPTPKVALLHEWLSPLMAIYGMPPVNVGESLADYGERIAAKVANRCSVVAAEIRSRANGRPQGRVEA